VPAYSCGIRRHDVALRRPHFRDRHGLHHDVTLRIEIERRRRPEVLHIAELPIVARNFELDGRAGYNEFRHGLREDEGSEAIIRSAARQNEVP
jgi:hypothetical protein